MLRVLALCTLLCLASGKNLRRLPDGYAQKLRQVNAAKALLQDRLVGTEYDVLKSDLHYLVMLSVVYYPAYKVRYAGGCVPPVVKDEYFKALAYDLPKVLLKPNDAVGDLQYVVKQTVEKLSPLTNLANKVCDGVSDFECDKLLQKLLESGDYPEAQKASLVLNNAAGVGNYLLSRDKRLQEVANSLDVLPYLLGNLSDGVDLVKVLVKLLRQVLPNKDVSLPC